jgi:hypothetical protein|tara:strand:- start:678 stop:947 length:270 start_codon:yes stop_codon:yes gene_type:complete
MKYMNLLFKVLVASNLVALNIVFFGAYKTIQSKLNLFKSDVSLLVEERLVEEYKYLTKDMETMKSSILDSQKKMIPTGGTAKTGLPIFK